jgi:uncharacterized repeat protein (TIGR01451 family)
MQNSFLASRTPYLKWLFVTLLVLGLLFPIKDPVVHADGDRQIYTTEGCYNVASFGVGMYGTGEGILTVESPGPVVDAFLEWVGEDDLSPPSPTETEVATSVLTITNGIISQQVTGIQVPGEAGYSLREFSPNPPWYAWYADIGPNGAGLITEPGPITLNISGWDTPTGRSFGATVSIVYSTGVCETPRRIVIKSGVDYYFHASPETLSDLLIYEFEAAPEERIATVRFAHAGTQQPQEVCRGGAIWMVAGSGTPPDREMDIVDRAPTTGTGFGINGGVEIIEHPFTGPTLPCVPSINPLPGHPYEAGHPYPGGAVTAPYRAIGIWPPEGGNIGPEWGLLTAEVLVPAGTTWVAFQLESQADQFGESGAWSGSMAFVLPSPELVVLKTNDADGDGQFNDFEISDTGDAIVPFRVVISNTSTRPVTITSIFDDIHGTDNELITNTEYSPDCAELLGTLLVPLEIVTCYFDGQIDLAGGGLETNTVTVTGVDPADSEVSGLDTSTVGFAIPGPAVQVVKSLQMVGDAQDGIVTVGQELTYTINVINIGKTTLTVVPLQDTYDTTYLEFLRASPEPDDATVPGTLKWVDLTGAGTLESLDEISITVTFRALASTDQLPNKQTINYVKVEGATDVNDEIAPTDEDEAPVRITDPAVAVVKTVSDPPNAVVELNGLVTFTLTISNIGDTRLDIVPVRDEYNPDDLEFVSTSLNMAPEESNGELFWSDITPELGNIAPGNAVSFTITFRFINPDVNTTTNRVILGDVIDEHGDFAGKPEGADDVSTVTKSPTMIILLSFTATANPGGIEIKWITGIEVDTLGFHLWRSEDRIFENAKRITEQMILPTGGISTGAAYSYVDTTANADTTYSYWLQEVETDGRATLYGPITGYSGTGAAPDQNGQNIYLPFLNR